LEAIDCLRLIEQLMKLLIIHNFYTQLTGEDLVIEDISQILKKSGKVKVSEYYKYSKEFYRFSRIKKISTLIKGNIPFYISSEFKEILNRERPDIALVYNLIPLVNIWILEELKKRDISVISSIYNYRLLCPRGTCTLKGKFCIRCFNNSLLCSILHNCLDNFFYSLLYAYRVFLQRLFLHHIDFFISATEFRRQFFKTLFPNKKIAFLRAYVSIPEHFKNPTQQKKDYAIFAGRLVEEKGITTILNCAELLRDKRFMICGEGPLMAYCQNFARERNLQNIECLGLVKRDELLQLIRDARMLIYPSLCYEFGGVAREAMLLGTPVIALRSDASAEWITHNKTGFLFEAGEIESLAQIIKRLWNDENLRTSIAVQAYERIKELNDPERYVQGLLNICQDVLARKQNN